MSAAILSTLSEGERTLLAILAEHNRHMPTAELIDELGSTKPTVLRYLHRFERSSLVMRVPRGRVLTWHILQRGREVVALMKPA